MIDYYYPISIEQAIQYLEAHDGQAQIIAGGTDVMADIRNGKIHPHCLVDITRIPGLDRIRVADDYVEIGATVTFSAIKDSAFLRSHVEALTEAARSVGAVGIQVAATWAGNIVQAMPAADGAIIALALEAEALVVDVAGSAWRDVRSLFQGPGVSAVDPTRQLITHVRFPRHRQPWGTAWKRIGRRPSLVLPILNCAVKLCLDPEAMYISRSTIALGAVARTPFRASRAEAFLDGQPLTAAVFAEAARIAQADATPRSSVMRASRGFRLAVIPPLVCDALGLASQRARADASRCAGSGE